MDYNTEQNISDFLTVLIEGIDDKGVKKDRVFGKMILNVAKDLKSRINQTSIKVETYNPMQLNASYDLDLSMENNVQRQEVGNRKVLESIGEQIFRNNAFERKVETFGNIEKHRFKVLVLIKKEK